jgi:hypothetical protein
MTRPPMRTSWASTSTVTGVWGARATTSWSHSRSASVATRQGMPRTTQLPKKLLEHLEGLRCRQLVNEVESDKELGLAGRQRPNRVGVPHVVEQGAWHEGLLFEARPAVGTATGVPALAHRVPPETL